MNFYNQRRHEIRDAVPNDGHIYLAKLQEKYDVQIFTQNIDDLHEKAGSKNVFHVHGDIRKARSMRDAESDVVDIAYNDIRIGDLHPDGSQLRPWVVFFGEFINYEEEAMRCCETSDYVVIVGTSLLIYPVARFPLLRQEGVPLYIVDPEEIRLKERYEYRSPNFYIKKPASTGVKEVYDILMKEAEGN